MWSISKTFLVKLRVFLWNFYFRTIITSMFTNWSYYIPSPSPFGSLASLLLPVIGHVQPDLVPPWVEVMRCVTTQVHAHMMPSWCLITGCQLKIVYISSYCGEKGTEPKIDRNGSLKNKFTGGHRQKTMAPPAFRVLFTEIRFEGERSPCTVDWSRDQVRQMTKSRSLAGGRQGSLPRPKYHPNAPP